MEEELQRLDSVVTLVGQTIQRTSYYRRFMILDTLIIDNKTAKSMLSDWEKTISDNDANSLFWNKFEEELCRSAKTKKKLKEVLKGLMSPITPAKQKPFQKGPRPSVPSRGGRGQSPRLSTAIIHHPSGPDFRRGTTTTTPGVRKSFPLPSVNLPVLKDFLPLAGRLRFFLKNWELISRDRFILDTVLGYQVPFL